MGSDMEMRFALPDRDAIPHVREALSELTSDDISKKSPIEPGRKQIGDAVAGSESSPVLVLRVQGHSGDWSKTTETAVRRAATSVGGVTHLSTDGGYEPASSASEDDSDDDTDDGDGAE